MPLVDSFSVACHLTVLSSQNLKTKQKIKHEYKIDLFSIGGNGIFTACNNNDGLDEDIENLPNITGYPIVRTNQSTSFNPLYTLRSCNEH